MKILLLLAVLFTTNANAIDLNVGQGILPMADHVEGKVYSFTIEHEKFKYTYAAFETYGRTPWLTWFPEWGRRIQDKHYTISVLKRVHRHEISTDFHFFIDFGLAYTSKLSRVNTTHVLFTENFGVTYKNFILYWRHTSNAGIKQPNTGEDALMLEHRFTF